jgi:hypothetical protein
MGSWGVGLYANDSTCDVRDSYFNLLQEGLSNAEAYEKILEQYREYIGDQDEPLFWFSLAETQWKTGRLLPEVRDKALYWIDKGGGMELWEESNNGGAGWKKTLQNLKLKLLSPMPSEKKICKPQKVNNNLWNINDVYAYQFHGEKAINCGIMDKYIVIQKIGEDVERFRGELMMRVHVLDRIFDVLPTLEDLNSVRILPLDSPERVSIKEKPIWMSTFLHMYKKSEYPAKYLTYIGNKQGPKNNMINNRVLAWSDMDIWLYEFYQRWYGVEYETIENGVYRYNRG